MKVSHILSLWREQHIAEPGEIPAATFLLSSHIRSNRRQLNNIQMWRSLLYLPFHLLCLLPVFIITINIIISNYHSITFIIIDQSHNCCVGTPRNLSLSNLDFLDPKTIQNIIFEDLIQFKLFSIFKSISQSWAELSGPKYFEKLFFVEFKLLEDEIGNYLMSLSAILPNNSC